MKNKGLLPAGGHSSQLAVLFFFPDGVALVVLLFAAGDADLDLDAAVFEVHRERDEGGALDRGGLLELFDFAAVGEEAAFAQGVVVELGGGGVGVDVGAVEDELAVLDAGEGFLELAFSVAEAFDFAAEQRDAALELGLDVVFMEGAAVGDARRVGFAFTFGHLVEGILCGLTDVGNRRVLTVVVRGLRFRGGGVGLGAYERSATCEVG